MSRSHRPRARVSDTQAAPVTDAPLRAEAAREDAVAQTARRETLERLALSHARADDAANACWYLCRSLGLARQQPDADTGLELLFDLLGALADLPLPETDATVLAEQADPLGVQALCEQLAVARAATAEVWDDAQEAGRTEAVCPTASARHLH